MIQSSEKTRSFFTLLIKIALFLFGITILLSYFKNGTISFSNITDIISIETLVLSFLAWVFNKFLWKVDFINRRVLAGKFSTPIIEGRWKGILIRENEPRDFVIEINQSFLSVSCRTFSVHSSSSSIIAELCYDSQLETHQFYYIWYGSTEHINEHEVGRETNSFNGVTIFDVIPATATRAPVLSGRYFTDRQPHQTRGTIKVEFISKIKLNCFE